MRIDDLDDENERAVAELIRNTLQNESLGGRTWEEMALKILATIQKDGWIPPEERDRAERERDAALVRIEEKDRGIAVLEEHAKRLQKQVDALSAMPNYSSGGVITTSPNITWTSFNTSTTPSAEAIAAVYGNYKRSVA